MSTETPINKTIAKSDSDNLNLKETREEIKDYYGKTLQSSADLQTNACCTLESTPKKTKDMLKRIHPEVTEKYYGCGLTTPAELKGKKILDLGSGSGRDCYLLSQLVGEEGEVVGVDMTDEQLDVANKYIDYHQKEFGFKKSNVSFKKGYIESLLDLNFKENYFDIVVSNCVVNLSADKLSVLSGIHKLLKPGGEFYFSDVYSDRRIPLHLQKDPVLYGECLSGALYHNDFIRLARQSGFTDPRKVKTSPISIQNSEIQQKTGLIRFASITYRLFKINHLEDLCEDYGQSVIYKGTIENSPHYFDLDDHHRFEKNRPKLVCGNTYSMLFDTRFKEHFSFYGDTSTHFGLFPDCGPESINNEEQEPSSCC